MLYQIFSVNDKFFSAKDGFPAHSDFHESVKIFQISCKTDLLGVMNDLFIRPLQAESHVGRQIYHPFLYTQVLRVNHIAPSYTLVKDLVEPDK